MSDGRTGRRCVVAVTGLAIEARIAQGPGVRCVIGGGDAKQLAAILRSACSGAIGMVSFGIGGGLGHDLEPGRIVVASRVIGATEAWATDAAWTSALLARIPDAVAGDVAGCDAIVADVDAKRALHRATGAIAVDTESQVAAAVAAELRVPLAVVRAIADPATRALPPATRVALRPGGRIDHARIIASVARTPMQIPGLLRIAMDARIALRALSRSRRLLRAGFDYPDLAEFLLDVA